MRGRAYRKHQRRRWIRRRRNIIENIWGVDLSDWGHRRQGGYWSKNKVHCSCEMCKYHREKDLKYQEKVRLANQEIREFLDK